MRAEIDLLTARVADCLNAARLGKLKFLGFLNEQEKSLVKSLTLKEENCLFFGGSAYSERVLFCCLPNWAQTVQFPIKIIQFKYKNIYNLTHRDFLGTLMSLGITREKLGDILVDKGKTIVFVHEDIADFILLNVNKVGGVGVELEVVESFELNIQEKFEDIRKTIASNRIDCVVSALTNLSRESSANFIKSKFVFVNELLCENISQRIENGYVLSLRGYGKFIVDSVSDVTKKGRLVLQVRKRI